MGREDKLTKAQDFATVHQRGDSFADRYLVLRGLPNGRESTRYGLSVSRRLGKAVVRNRVKRRLREILRALPMGPGWDLVLIPRPQAALADFHTLQESLARLVARAGAPQARGGRI